MFYSNQILARKGPLGLVWIAAHMEGRLKRQQINSTSIPASVDTLLDPEVPLALRLSGQLLLGVVRIYARKVAYLQQDCDAALVKIRVALCPADTCNLPPGSQVAPVEAITLLADSAAAAASRKACAAASSKAAADGRNNAAAAAAVVNGWLGPVDEDGLMLGLDDLAWDEEVLLGEGPRAGFGLGGLRFEPNTRLSFGMTPSKSGLGSQDISGVFGMYSSQDEMQETFDLEDEEAAAVWDLDEFEVEKLRAAAPGNSQRDSGVMSGLLGGDETPAGGARPGKGAAAGGGDGSVSAGGPLGDDGFTPGSLPAQDEADRDLQEDAEQLTPRAGDGAADQQHDPYDLDLDLGNLDDMLPPTPAADEQADAQADAGAAGMDADAAQQQQQPAAATKTFVRRNARQQAQEAEEGAGGDDVAAGKEGDGAGAQEQRVAPVTAAKSVRRRRVSGLLGLKRRVMVDLGEEPGADGRASSARHTPTELPAAEIRALLADRAPLMDKERAHKVSRLLQQQAASSLTALGAAAAAQRQLQTITAAAAAAGAAAAPAGPAQAVAAAAAAAEVVAAAGSAGAGRAGVRRLQAGAGPGLGLSSLSAGFAGGMGLPAELQQLFSNAAAAAPASAAAAAVGGAAAAAGCGEAGAVAPIAPLEEIGGFGDELDQDLEGFAAAGTLNPGLAGGGTGCSLSLSLTCMPDSAAGGSGGGGLLQHPTPGTDAATAAGFGPTPGSAGFTPGMQGYTPGYTPGSELNPDMPMDATADDADVLQPLDDANMGPQLGQEGASLGGIDLLHDGWVGGHDGEGKENAPAPGGKGANSAGGSMVWPADAETLLEQEAADHEAPAGSFTARTRLVVRHLQHAAAAAGAGGAGGPGMTPASIGSKRRISAAAAGLGTGPPAGGKDGEGATGAAAGAFEGGPVLSFDGITRGHSRLDACRWFYEALVLSNRGLVQLQQDESYGDIRVVPNLAGMARV